MKFNLNALSFFPLMLTFGALSAALSAQPVISGIEITAAARVDISFQDQTSETDFREKVWLFDEAKLATPVDYSLDKSVSKVNTWSLTFPMTADIYRLSYLEKDPVTAKSALQSLAVIEKLSDDLEGVSLGKDDPAYDAYDCSLDPTMCETEVSANPIALMLMQQAACGAKPEVC